MAPFFIWTQPQFYLDSTPNSRDVFVEWLSDPQVWLALVTLTALEIVLGYIKNRFNRSA